MTEKSSLAPPKAGLAKLPPLAFGRATRVVFGIGTLYWADRLGTGELGLAGMVALVFLGISFLLGGVLGNPGCELTALPNLVLPQEKRIHCV